MNTLERHKPVIETMLSFKKTGFLALVFATVLVSTIPLRLVVKNMLAQNSWPFGGSDVFRTFGYGVAGHDPIGFLKHEYGVDLPTLVWR